MFRGWIIAMYLFCFASVGDAFEHEDSLVNFDVYGPGVLAKNSDRNKPYFLLFSAEWCHWCHEFAHNTLVREDVATYLNDNFVNIFIDVDINNSAYVEYRATGLPFTVFLNPDRSLYYKYSGTLYGDDFLDVIKRVSSEAGVGKYALGMESSHISYTPPGKLSVSELEVLPGVFTSGVLDNFDLEEYGVGKGQKSILPRTFLYLLQNAEDREEAFRLIGGTFERAVDQIYDPVEGGFFRYAETRNWQIPHYEKFSDLNAGAVLLMHQINEVAPSGTLQQAMETTLEYLNSTLFDADIGSYLSFQIADTSYYLLGDKYRKSATPPKVMDKIFTDRLAVTLDYLVELTAYAKDPQLQERVKQSLDFMARMVMAGEGMNRFYSTTDKKWYSQSGLSDHAYVSRLFTNAASRFNDPRYTAVAVKTVQSAISRYYDAGLEIFVDPAVDNSTNVEYLMEINGLMAQSMIDLDDRLDTDAQQKIDSIIAYFSLMAEVLEDRFWDAVEWEFTESYVPYLEAVNKYLVARNPGDSGSL
jgi:uncharacterized protein YyaL (SSP411 family)